MRAALIALAVVCVAAGSVIAAEEGPRAVYRAFQGHIDCEASVNGPVQCPATSNDATFSIVVPSRTNHAILELEWETTDLLRLSIDGAAELLPPTTATEGRSVLRLQWTPIPLDDPSTLLATVGPAQAAPSILRQVGFDLHTTLFIEEAHPSDDYSAALGRGSILLPVSKADVPAAQGHAAVPPPQTPSSTAFGLGVLGFTTATLFVAWFRRGWLLGLFARLSRDRLAEHPRRAAILQAVAGEPGVRSEELRRRLDIPNGSFRHHVDALRVARLVVVTRDGPGVRLYDARSSHPRMRPSVREQVIAAVQAHKGITSADLAGSLSISRRLANHHVRALERERRIFVEERLGSRRCYPRPDTV